MTSFNWLHLTDLHYGLSGQPPLWPDVRQAFFNDLARLHKHCGPVHAVLFTGDLVQAGQKDEFEKLEEKVLEPLWEKLRELGSRDAVLLAVPGNHDLLRPKGKNPTAALKQLIRPDGYYEIAQQFWSKPTGEYRHVINVAFANYVDWWKRTSLRGSVTLQDGVLPGDFSATLQFGPRFPNGAPVRIGIVGLNTTFLQLTVGDYKERLALDAKQIHAVCDGDVPKWIGKHDACVLLTHQGPEWLDKRSIDDYPETNPAGRFAVHLFGHIHENVSRSTTNGGGKPLRLWQSCSLFGMEKFGEPPTFERRHGYTVGRIEFAEKTATIRHWPRRAFKDANGWRFERDLESCILNESDGGTYPDYLTSDAPATRASSPKTADAGLSERNIDTNRVGFETERIPNGVQLIKAIHTILAARISNKSFRVPLDYKSEVSFLRTKLDELYSDFESLMTKHRVDATAEEWSRVNAGRRFVHDRLDTLPNVLGLAIARFAEASLPMPDISIRILFSRFVELTLTDVISNLAGFQFRGDALQLFTKYADIRGNIENYVAHIDGVPVEKMVSYRVKFLGDDDERIIFVPLSYGNDGLRVYREFINSEADYIPPISFTTGYAFPQMLWWNFNKPDEWNFQWKCQSIFVKDRQGHYLSEDGLPR